MRRTRRMLHPHGHQLDDSSPAARSRKSKIMVVIADSFRAHWEAEDELRRIREREASAEWLCWFPIVNASTNAEMSCRDGVCESGP